MSVIRLPENLNLEDLYTDVVLTATSSRGGVGIDFTGTKTYTIEMFKENLGFGITDVKVEIGASLQPIIEISFKDLYGNLAFGLLDESRVNNSESVDFRVLWELPYPKFKLTIKGYLGKPISLLLNLKKTVTTLNPDDGSYSIKAIFIPNLYGFFSDLPFLYLKAAKALKVKYGNPNPNGKTLSDIIQYGSTYQKEVQRATEHYDGSIRVLEALANTEDKDYSALAEYDFKKPISYPNISEFKEMIFNVEFRDSKSKVDGLWGVNNSSKLKVGLLNSLVSKDKKLYFEDFLVKGYAENSTNKSRAQQGLAIVSKNLQLLKESKVKSIVTGNEQKIQSLTISNVFDLLAGDSAFIMGLMFAAGLRGFKNNPGRKEDEDLSGLYWPVKENGNGDLIPAGTEELNFTKDFIAALTTAIVSERKTGIPQDGSSFNNVSNSLVARLNNIEIESPNPYVGNNATQLISNILERSSFGSYLTFTSNENDIKTLALQDSNNFKGFVGELSSVDKAEIKMFYNFIKTTFDTNGDVKIGDAVYSSINPSEKITILNSNVKINTTNKKNNLTENDFVQLNVKTFLSKYINSASGINKDNFNTKQLFHNGHVYIKPDTPITQLFSGKYALLIYKNKPEIKSNSNKITQNISVPGFNNDDVMWDVIEISTDNYTDWNKYINDGGVIDYELTKQSSGQFTTNDLLFKHKITETEASSSTYLGAVYKRNSEDFGTNSSDLIWGPFEENNFAKYQRIFIRALSKYLVEIINQDDVEKEKEIKNTIKQLSQQETPMYLKFHHLFNNWKNLIDDIPSFNPDDEASFKKLGGIMYDRYTQKKNTDFGFVYSYPLQDIENITPIKVEDAIINIRPLLESNSQTTVLNIFYNVCTLNNFLFLSIPGNGFGIDDITQVFSPSLPIYGSGSGNIEPPMGNFFYIMFMPTPENRISSNSNNLKFINNLPNLKKDVFAIEYGSTKNSIFKRINGTSEDNKITAESVLAIESIVNPTNSNKPNFLDCSMLSVFEGRSYKINIEMLGNAQIAPTMHCMVDKIPVFNGLYQIMKVEHKITPNNFTTSIEGIKMKFYDKSNKFIGVPPFTLMDLGLNSSNEIQDEIGSEIDQTVELDISKIANSNWKDEMGKISDDRLQRGTKALLETISYAEGTIGRGQNGYDIIYSYKLIPSWTPNYTFGHQNNKWKQSSSGIESTAAGRYQFLGTSWFDYSTKEFKRGQIDGNIYDVEYYIKLKDGTRKKVQGKNAAFTKKNQDYLAGRYVIDQLKIAGVSEESIEDAVTDGRLFQRICNQLSYIWASIPQTVGSVEKGRYGGQPTKKVSDLFAFFKEAIKKY